ncbi:hypothetical protein [Thauera phenolivorans]|uniref:hypothetical protein n=1 Tax=Thauera phenolivorans TaxID=1792543 RepID=UPI00083B3D69|nr:hypothetical protein [Thauera phenolivorans]
MDHQLVVMFHLLCAVLFVGAVAMEVLILEPVRKLIGDELFQQVEFYLFRRIRRTYPFAVIPLYITGFYMYFGYIESFGGFAAFIDTRFGMMLTVKMSLALGLLTIFATSPFVFMQHRSRSAGGHLKHFLIVTGGPEDFRIDRFEAVHYLAMGLGIGIVVLAKLMFML